MSRRINILENTDWITILLYLVLVCFGWVNIYSVNYVEATGFDFSIRNKYSMQILWIAVSMILAIIIFLIDSRFYSFVAFPGYAFSLLLLLAVVVIGQEVNGAKSWINIGPVKLQPSEFAKLATILALAKYLSGFNVKSDSTRNIVISLAIIFTPLIFIMLQPDLGSTLVYGAMLLVLYREGLPGWVLLIGVFLVGLFLGFFLLKPIALLIALTSCAYITFYLLNRNFKNFYVGIGILAACTGLGFVLQYFNILPLSDYLVFLSSLILAVIISLLLTMGKKIQGIFITAAFLMFFIGFIFSIDFMFHNIMKPHQRNRVEVMLGLKSDPWGYEYNVNQSKIAIGSGGFTGRGFLQGPQTKLKYVPEQSTDFIFCTVGEEWGFIGSLALVAVFVTLLLRLIYISERQRSRFSRVFGYGVVTILFFHFAVNIAMTIAIFPVIGIPLPFISYGGSSLMAFTMMVFILLRLDSGRKTYLV